MADNRSVVFQNQDSQQNMNQPQQSQPEQPIVYIPEFKFGRNFEGKKGMIDQEVIIADRVVCIYFAASFCHPSRAFTPKLIEFYNEVNTEEKLLEIILVSFDKNEDDMRRYFRTMPWISLPFDQERIESYRNHFNVKGIPQLVVLNKDGSVLLQDACKDVLKKGEDAFLDWIKLIDESQNLISNN